MPEPARGPALARALFAPRGVALVGASADPAKNTARPLRFLRAHGFPGRVAPVNPRRDTVQGAPCWPSVSAAPGPLDQAFIMVPAPAVAAAIEDCAAAGVRVATVYSDGFAEAGRDGDARQAELVALGRRAGVRILGPSSMGVIGSAERLALSVNAVLEMDALPRGRLALVSQSGTMLGTLLSRAAARGIGFSRLVSVGNEADIGVGELVDLLVDDEATQAILVFLEGLRDAPAFAAATRRADAAGKPVLAYKLGRSETGRALARSHSGAVTGAAGASSAFFAAHGIVEVTVLETLFELPPMLARPPAAHAGRVGVMTTTGGGAAMVVDRLGALGVECLPPPESARAALALHGIRVGDGPLVDLTMAGTRPEVFGAGLDALLDCEECDAVLAVIGSSGQFHPELAVGPIVERARAGKPLAVFVAPQADASLRLLAEAGVAAFRTPESCADGIRAFVRRRPPRPPIAGRRRLDIALPAGPCLDEVDSLALIAAAGVPVVPCQRLRSPSDPVRLGFPVALKLCSPGLAHKSEAGAVALGLADAAAVAAAGREILGRADGPGAGLIAQPMRAGLAEVLVGFLRDPEAGPIVTLGAGGVLAEIYADVAVRVAPVPREEALAMIEEVRGLAPLRGYRGHPRGDLDALADAVAALSRLAGVADPAVLEAEVNPLLVGPEGEGVVAVDGLVTLAHPAAVEGG